MGSVHEELCLWLTRPDAKANQLILMPRDHGKSRYAAFYVLWELTKDPTKRILYISATADLAEKQLGFIKDKMSSERYQEYWPEMLNPEVGKRKKWSVEEIIVDHPDRLKAGIRDPSIKTAGLTTKITGLHFDLAVLDDVVVQENAYSEEGRGTVRRQFSHLASVEAANAKELAVGTRYHPKDLYGEMIDMYVEVYDEDGEQIDTTPVYETFERKVETRGDGSGQFLWPRQKNEVDGKWYGFDQQILATKRAKYIPAQFYAQYYNNPNESSDATIKRDHFQYFDPTFLKQSGGYWYYKGNRVNLLASADLAYTTSERADYTSLVLCGIDAYRNYYVLDVDRYKTKSTKEHYERIMEMHKKWDFRKLVVEGGPAGETVLQTLKESHFKPNGIMISTEIVKVPRNEGTKEEQIRAILEPLYQNTQVWHYRGGNCQILEDELVLRHPPHDDCKDAVANAFKVIKPPTFNLSANTDNVIDLQYHPRWGGVAS